MDDETLSGKNTRVFTFWCRHCPTRVRVYTDCPPEAVIEGGANGVRVAQFSYKPSDGVGGNSRDGDYEKATLCPACGMKLVFPEAEGRRG